MRSGLLYLLATALVASSLLIGGPTARGSADVLLDEGFEDGVGAWNAEGGVLATTSAFFHEGVQSAAFTAMSIDDPTGTGVIQHQAPIPVQSHRSYSLRAYFLNNDTRVESIVLCVIWKRDDNTYLSQSRSPRLTDNQAGWQYLTFDVLSPENAAFAEVRVLVTATTGGRLYLDDVQFEGPPALPATATPSPAEGPPQEPSPTATAALSGTATPTRVASPSPSAVPSATPTTGVLTSLVNGGFEDADDGVLIGWSKYGGELSQTAAHYRSGGHSGAFRSTTDSTKWVYQALTVAGGSAYQFDAYVLLNDPGAQEAFLRISWYESDDASGSAIAVSDSQARLSGNDPSFRYLTTGAALAPETARSARFRIMLVPASSAPATVYMDDASVRQAAPELAATPAPPPATEDGSDESSVAAEGPPDERQQPTPAAARSVLRQGESPFAVKVNEVMYDPPQPGDEAAWEWLELYNAGSQPVDLAGWTLTDNSASDELPSLVLAAPGYALIAASERFRATYPAFGGALITLEDGRIGNGLANKGDRVLLYDSSGNLADGVSWGDDVGVLAPAVGAVAPGHSIERSPPGHDTDAAVDFVDNANPSPGRGIGEAAVAGAAVQRQAISSSTISPPETTTRDATSSILPRLMASLVAGVVALAAALSVGMYWGRRFASWP